MSSPREPFRVMIVDDSVVVRRALSQALDEHAEVRVEAVSASGTLALRRIDGVRPDVVLLDVDMPELDGIATLRALRARKLSVPVILLSAMDQRGAEAAMQAVALGAVEIVPKPPERELAGAGLQQFVDVELLPRIREISLARRSLRPAAGRATKSVERLAPRPPPVPSRVRFMGPRPNPEVLLIGSSTGGPNALAALFERWPQLPVPVLMAQHMPPLFTSSLARRLDGLGPCRVREAVDGDELEPGLALVAPGDYHMLVESGAPPRVRLTRDPPENSCRPAVDPLFRSAAEVFGPKVLALILTGMGQDGLRGAEAITAAGGAVLAQDEASSVVWGMPGAVAKAGVADAVLPLDQLGEEALSRLARIVALRAGKAIGS